MPPLLPQVVKKLWEYIKAHGLQDPKDKRVIVFDDRLKTLFTGTRCNMFKLQKQLSKHCKTSGAHPHCSGVCKNAQRRAVLC